MTTVSDLAVVAVFALLVRCWKALPNCYENSSIVSKGFPEDLPTDRV